MEEKNNTKEFIKDCFKTRPVTSTIIAITTFTFGVIVPIELTRAIIKVVKES